MTRITNGLTAIVAALVLAIGAGAFILSYDALRATALAGGIPPGLTWLWPLLIDAPLVVFTLALLVAQLTRQSVKLWAGLVILYTVGTVAFNLVHATPGPLGWAVAVVAPLGLLLTTEALRHLSRGIIERSHAILSLAELGQQVDRTRGELAELLTAKQAHLDRLNSQIEQTSAKLEQVRIELKAVQIEQKSASIAEMNAVKQAKIDQRRADVLGLVSEGMTPAAIADELRVSLSTVKRDLTALNGKVSEVRQ